MGYTFRIGKALPQERRIDEGVWVRPATEDVEDAPHTDEYEVPTHSGTAERQISYSTWTLVRSHLPVFDQLIDELEQWAEKYRTPFIPIGVYRQNLDDIREEATALLEGEPRLTFEELETEDVSLRDNSTPEAGAALRALWFVEWSEVALEEYGRGAAFQTPKEWASIREPPALGATIES